MAGRDFPRSEFTRFWNEEDIFRTEDMNDEIDEDTVCGIGRFKPRWIQWLATPRAFMTCYCILGILDGAASTYLVGVLSTLERRYAYDSQISGFIMAPCSVSAITSCVLIAFYGGDFHRPRWVAGGMMTMMASCLLSAIPYFLYGPAVHLLSLNVQLNSTSYQLCGRNATTEEPCDEGHTSTYVTVAILVVANFLGGFGFAPYYAVGTVYMDDNIKKKDSPVYFGIQMSLRLLGPSFGYVLASFSLQYYEDPFFDPGLTNKDPRWVGAWWVGFLILGFLLLFFSLPMLLFPKRMPGTPKLQDSQIAAQQKAGKLMLKDMPSTFYRLLGNPLWFFHTLSVIFHINGYMGYFILMPRYMEAHFRQSASSASFFSGATSMVTMIIGIMLGGIAISRLRPRPRVLTGYMAAVTFFSVVAMAAAMFLACPQLNVVGKPNDLDGTLDMTNDCNAGCECNTRVFHPVCSADGESTYFSPCYAGCASKFDSSGNSTVLHDCKCDAEATGEYVLDLIAEHCPFNCNLFIPYIVIMSLSKMIGATSKVGAILVNLRCVDAKDKNLSLGGLTAMISIFALIPYPFVFGALADSTCLVWEEKCGKRGNCWVYDLDKLRLRMHGAAFGLILVSTVFEIIVWHYSKRLPVNFYDDQEDQTEVVPGEMQLKDIDSAVVVKQLPDSHHENVAFL